MKTKTPTAAARTARPELWASTYWAPCRDARLVPAEIIRHRGAFARRWKLKTQANVCLSPLRTYGPGWEIDHLELYRDTRGALVAVCSNYGHPPPPCLGMAETPPLYVIGSKSYAARFETIRALRAAFRRANNPQMITDYQMRQGTPRRSEACTPTDEALRNTMKTQRLKNETF